MNMPMSRNECNESSIIDHRSSSIVFKESFVFYLVCTGSLVSHVTCVVRGKRTDGKSCEKWSVVVEQKEVWPCGLGSMCCTRNSNIRPSV